MNPFSRVATIFASMATWSLDVADAIYGTVFVPNIVGDWFYNTSSWFFDVYLFLLDAAAFYQDITYRAAEWIRSIDVPVIMAEFIDRVNELWRWFTDWTAAAGSVLSAWWDGLRDLVLDWINVAVQAVADQVGLLTTDLAALRISWNDFIGRLPAIDELLSWWGSWPAYVLGEIRRWWTGAMGDVQALINTAFTTRESLWSGWADIRENVMEFFTDPVEFLWERFVDWFLGPEV